MENVLKALLLCISEKEGELYFNMIYLPSTVLKTMSQHGLLPFHITENNVATWFTSLPHYTKQCIHMIYLPSILRKTNIGYCEQNILYSLEVPEDIYHILQKMHQ